MEEDPREEEPPWRMDREHRLWMTLTYAYLAPWAVLLVWSFCLNLTQ
jgi:hypothetical protein